jgi:homoserine O-succinyltransferase/O-acetyltransferase
MPVTLEPRRKRATPSRTIVGRPGAGAAMRIGLINNMPDAALQSTEAQFRGLLEAAAGEHQISVRLSSFPELPRGAEALERIREHYWPIEELLEEPLEGLIVTGTEPRAPQLKDEPYWGRFGDLLEWAQNHTAASIWSCLAAHAAVETLDGIQRQRLAQKRCGVYEHHTLSGHALLQGVSSPLPMPHSRWNELPVDALRSAGYTLLSWSAAGGADAFLRERRGSLLLFFQGHPEYEDTTLLKEYRRDVGRYLSGTQANYPTLPVGYLSERATAELEAFGDEARARREAAQLEKFPFAAVAQALTNRWQSSAVAMYRNWLAVIAARRTAARAPEPLSLRNR